VPGAATRLGQLTAARDALKASMGTDNWGADTDHIKLAKPLLDQADGLITRGDAAVTEARAQETSGYKLVAAISTAPQELLAHTKQISSIVNLQLSRAPPSPDAVFAVASKLRSGADALTAAVAPPAKAASGNSSSQPEGQGIELSKGTTPAVDLEERDRLIR